MLHIKIGFSDMAIKLIIQCFLISPEKQQQQKNNIKKNYLLLIS